MAVAPMLDPNAMPGPRRRRYALLINPFYRKDPNASFGKHVLTPTLALTAIAGATPASWEVRYWDENLLQGSPPLDPFPEVVGITVHLTFAKRAYELARWYRQWGAKVVLGGLHVLTAPDEAAEHADALAIGEGTQLWSEILADVEAGALRKIYRGDYKRPYREDPPPRRDLLPRAGFLTTSSVIATRGCHNRCGFCYLSTEGLAHAISVTRRGAGRRRDRGGSTAVCRVRRQQSRLPAGLSAQALRRPEAARHHLERSAHDRRDGRPVAGARDGPGGVHGRVHRFRVTERRESR